MKKEIQNTSLRFGGCTFCTHGCRSYTPFVEDYILSTRFQTEFDARRYSRADAHLNERCTVQYNYVNCSYFVSLVRVSDCELHDSNNTEYVYTAKFGVLVLTNKISVRLPCRESAENSSTFSTASRAIKLTRRVIRLLEID